MLRRARLLGRALVAWALLASVAAEARPAAPRWRTPDPGEVQEAKPFPGLDLARSVASAAEAGSADRDVVVSMAAVPELADAAQPTSLRFRFELAYRDGRWLPAPQGFTATVYNHHWPWPPHLSNVRIRGEALAGAPGWTREGGLECALIWGLEKPFRDLVGGSRARKMPGSVWDLVPQEGEVRVELPLNPVAKHPRSTGLPPWWQPTVFGFNYYGSFRYAAAGKTFEGEAELNVLRRPIPGRFVPWTACEVAQEDGGVRFRATLPKRRVAAEAGGFAMCELPEAVDASSFDGLRLTVETDSPRRDAAVALGLKEGTGAWYHTDFACPLTQETNTWIVPFARLVKSDFVLGRGFFDPDMAFTADDVKALAVGAVNPFGVGDVEFLLTKLELVRWTDGGYAAAPAEAVEVTVDATTAVSRNGVDTVPEELFGVHLVHGLDEAKLPRPERKRLNVRHARPLLHTSFEAGGSVAVPDEGAIRTLGLEDACIVTYTWGNLWGRGPWMDRPIEQILPGVREWGRRLGESAWRGGADAGNALRRVEFWNEPFMWGRHINAYDAALKDPTQHGYIPAELGTKRYAEMFLAAARAAREANGHVKFGGMSSPAFGSDSYSVFQDYVRHFIDAAAPEIDFLTEHHYGGKPESYAAQYEVVTAYCDTRHGVRIPIVNTEANDLVDTPTFGDEGLPAPWSKHADDLIRFRYNMRDVMTMIAECPDKARARAMHALWGGEFSKKGEAHFFELCNNVRGTILDARSSDPDVPAVAVRDGTGRCSLVILNDSPYDRAVSVHLGGRFGARELRRVIFDGARGTQVVTEEVRPRLASRHVARIAPRCAVALTFSWMARPMQPALARRELRQHFAAIHLERVGPGEVKRGEIRWRPGRPRRVKAAWLRIVTDGVQPGEGSAGVGSQEVALPESAPGEPVIQDIPLDARLIRRAREAVFSCRNSGREDGFRVLMAAVYIEE